MLSWEDDVEAHALRRRGWSISAIARHLGHDRKTVRAYLRGDREPGQRASRGPDVMAPFAEYCRIRLADDPHLWASALLDELRELGYQGSYPSLTAAIRARGPQRGGGWRSSRTSRVRRPSSTGGGCPARRQGGAAVATRTCWSAPCQPRAGGVGCWPRPRTSRPWPRRWMRWCAGWAG